MCTYAFCTAALACKHENKTEWICTHVLKTRINDSKLNLNTWNKYTRFFTLRNPDLQPYHTLDYFACTYSL